MKATEGATLRSASQQREPEPAHPTHSTRERPILFSGEMVRAILEGRKTQTRRAITAGTSEVSRKLWGMLDWTRCFADRGYRDWQYLHVGGPDDTMHRVRCRIAEPGDVLWVRENLRVVADGIEYAADNTECASLFSDLDGDRTCDLWNRYAHEDGPDIHPTTIPSIHAPRWTSRISLEVTSIRVERVQAMCELDARAEGIGFYPRDAHDAAGYAYSPTSTRELTAKDVYKNLWDSLNEKRGYSWDSNPWVWVIEFRVASQRGDQK